MRSADLPISAVAAVMHHYRFFSRQPYVELDGPVIRLRLPGIFGGRKIWNLDAGDVAVVDTEPSSSDDSGEGWVFENPVNIPYAVTTSPNANPNLEPRDPALLEVAEANDRRQRWVGAVGMVAVILIIGLNFFGGENPSNWEFGALGLGVLVIFGLPVWARRRGARPLDAGNRESEARRPR